MAEKWPWVQNVLRARGLSSVPCGTIADSIFRCLRVDGPRRLRAGWKHLLVTDESYAAVLEEANQAQPGKLFLPFEVGGRAGRGFR